MARGWNQGLEWFLNKEALASHSDWSRLVRDTLLECVDLAMRYKKDLAQAKTAEDKKKAAEVLYSEVYIRRLRRILEPDPDLPGQPPAGASGSFSVFPAPSKDPLEVFSPRLIVKAGDQYQQYALDFLYTLTDPEQGPRRVCRCQNEKCRKIGLGRPQKLYCSDACRYTHNNARRPREANREAVRKYRREIAEEKSAKLAPRNKVNPRY